MTSDPMIRVVLADDNVIVREGVRALLSVAGDVEVVGVAGDYDELLAGAAEHVPQVVVTDIRMPPDFTDEGIRAARLVRKRSPGTGNMTSRSTRYHCSARAPPGTRTCSRTVSGMAINSHAQSAR